MVKKYKKHLKSMGETAMVSAGMGMALVGVGGTSAVHGATGISRATAMMPAMGSVAGAGALVRTIDTSFKNKKKKRR